MIATTRKFGLTQKLYFSTFVIEWDSGTRAANALKQIGSGE